MRSTRSAEERGRVEEDTERAPTHLCLMSCRHLTTSLLVCPDIVEQTVFKTCGIPPKHIKLTALLVKSVEDLEDWGTNPDKKCY